jgi:hypothetical protein
MGHQNVATHCGRGSSNDVVLGGGNEAAELALRAAVGHLRCVHVRLGARYTVTCDVGTSDGRTDGVGETLTKTDLGTEKDFSRRSRPFRVFY